MEKGTNMTKAIDISGLNFQQLDELRHRVEHRVTEMRETGAPSLREQWIEQAAAIRMTIEEILESGQKARPRQWWEAPARRNSLDESEGAGAWRASRLCLAEPLLEFGGSARR